MDYRGILPEHKTWVRIAGVLIGGFMIFLELAKGQYVYIPIAILVILACFFKKEQIVSEEGINLKYTIFGIVINNNWTWNELTAIRTDRGKSKPNVRMQLCKDVAIRPYIMTSNDCDCVLRMARDMNPDIYIDDETEEAIAEREAELLHRQEVVRAQKAAKRRKKQNNK